MNLAIDDRYPAYINKYTNGASHRYYSPALELASERYIALNDNPKAQITFARQQSDAALQRMKVICCYKIRTS
jgi:hypothetical protein